MTSLSSSDWLSSTCWEEVGRGLGVFSWPFHTFSVAYTGLCESSSDVTASGNQQVEPVSTSAVVLNAVTAGSDAAPLMILTQRASHLSPHFVLKSNRRRSASSRTGPRESLTKSTDWLFSGAAAWKIRKCTYLQNEFAGKSLTWKSLFCMRRHVKKVQPFITNHSQSEWVSFRLRNSLVSFVCRLHVTMHDAKSHRDAAVTRVKCLLYHHQQQKQNKYINKSLILGIETTCHDL